MVSSSNEKPLSNEKRLISKGLDRRRKESHRKWTVKEDKALMAALSALCKLGWKRENGTFKSGYIYRLENELESALPGANLKASPHIESRLKLLKRQYDALIDMKGANGMQWNRKEHTMMCWDDDVWCDWVKSHPFAKGLRNRPFPYYEDLHCIFGNRNKRKRSEKASGSEVQNGNVRDVVETEAMNGQKIMDHGESENGMADKVSGGRENSAEFSDENDDYESKSNMMAPPLHCFTNPNPDSAIEEIDDLVGGECPNGLNLSIDAAREPEISTRGAATPARTVSADKNSLLSDLEELRKIFGTFLQKHGEHFTLLLRMLGKELSLEKTATEKRTGLNGELRKLSNLNLRARLRVATLIVGDPAKLDLFYSLPENEREEWVSMLLSGII